MKAQYKALIIDTILKEIRSKTLIFIFIATTLAIILGQMILSMVNNNMGGDQNLSLTGINILSINFRILNSISFIIAAVFGVSVFRSDFQNNIIYQYLAFPISRIEYFFIRVVGTWILVLVLVSVFFLIIKVTSWSLILTSLILKVVREYFSTVLLDTVKALS